MPTRRRSSIRSKLRLSTLCEMNDSTTIDPRSGLVLFTCCFALFIVTLDNSVANVALPSIQRSLHAGPQELQWIVDSYILVRGSLMMSAGAVADRVGRRRLFRLGLMVFAVASLACS